MRRTTADEPNRNDRGLLMEAEVLNTPTPDVKTVTQDDSTHIPDFAIERLARFFHPLMQMSLSEKPAVHLQRDQKGDMMHGKEVSA